MLRITKKNAFFRNVAVLISGTAVAQGLMIASAPLLSRLYDPEVFGVFAIYSSIVGILSVMMTWQYELAIVLPQKEEESVNVVALSSIIVISMTIFISLLILFFGSFIVELLGSSQLSSLLWWVPISVFAVGFYQILSYWSIRRKQFNRLSTSQLFRSGSAIPIQLSGGVAGLGSTGLIGGQIAGQITASAVLGYQVWKDDKRKIIQSTNFKTMKRLAKEYTNFPLYSAPQSLLSAVSRNIPPFLLAFFYGPEVVGYYAISLKLVQMPVDVIGESIRNVFFQKASEYYNTNGKISSLMKKATFYLAAVAIVPALMIIFWGPHIFTYILGDEWHVAGTYARWMTVWLFFGFINIPAFVSAQTVGLQKHLLTYESSLLILRSAALFIGLKYFSALMGMVLFCVVAGIFNLLLIVGVSFFVKQVEEKLALKEQVKLIN